MFLAAVSRRQFVSHNELDGGKLDVTQLSIISRTSQFFNLCRKYKKAAECKNYVRMQLLN